MVRIRKAQRWTPLRFGHIEDSVSAYGRRAHVERQHRLLARAVPREAARLDGSLGHIKSFRRRHIAARVQHAVRHRGKHANA